MPRREAGIAGLLGQLRQPEPPPESTLPAVPPDTPTARHRRVDQPSAVQPQVVGPRAEARILEEPRDGRRPGRSRTGKRSNPDYALRGLWLRRETYLDVTDRLRRRREYADASELVQALLEDWLRRA